MYIQHNMEMRSCNHCYSGEAVSSTYYECMCVTLVIQHAMHLHHIVVHGLPLSTVFFHFISYMARFKKKKKLLHTCVLISSTTVI